MKNYAFLALAVSMLAGCGGALTLTQMALQQHQKITYPL